MATLQLRISIVDKNVTKTIGFDPSTSVYDACRIIREKISEANMGEAKDYGLFLSDEDIKKGVWLEPGRDLEYYILRNGDLLEYRKKLRKLRVRMLDGTVKTMLVDDSQPVANLMVVICTKIGITNYDEYSLVCETHEEEVENKPNFGTLTLKRRKEEKERDAKMDQLRKKIKTDDEVNWVDSGRTLREQGIGEGETVLLKRKFFFSDQNIDSRDPVQLNLLYVQARDAILNSTHPVTQQFACMFAGLQAHIQFGDHVESKHKPPFLDLKEFLPQSYIKVKGIEKKIFQEHAKHIGISELDAKVLYTKNARSLPTYGVTFFLVKEKMKGKNKLVPRLLGVTKDSVLRLDEQTKEILETYPLTTVRRWCASPNTFTLDFGDYSDQYYSVQTPDGEQIVQLISGYIDIILKKKKSKDHFGIDGEEGAAMVEDSVSPLKATILQHETSRIGKVNTESVAKPAVMRAADGAKPIGTGHVGGALYTTVSGQVNIGHTAPTVQQTQVTSVLTEPQRALLSTITAGQQVITTVERELLTRTEIPELGTDAASRKWKETTVDTNKQNVSSQLAAMNAATAQVVTLTSGSSEEVDHTAVGAAITTITTGLPEVSRGVRMLAALIDDDSGDKLLDATRKLCTAFTDLLKAAEPATKEPRQNLLNAASRVGEASRDVLTEIHEEDPVLKEAQDTLLGLGKAVANKAAALVLRGKSVASTLNQPEQNRAIGVATQCALTTSQLVACAKVVAPTIQSPPCQQQLEAAVKEVTHAVESLVTVCNESCSDQQLLGQLSEAAADVTVTLNQLVNHIRQIGGDREREAVESTSVEQILITSERVLEASGDPGEMVKQARLLGQATAQLIQSIKGEAESQESGSLQRRLLAAAKLLAEATARMVEAARTCASNPHDIGSQNHLKQTVEELLVATNIVASPTIRKKLISSLEVAAKNAAGAANQCITSSQGASKHNTNKQSQNQLNSDCAVVNSHIPALIQGVKQSAANPDNPSAQLHLINVSQQFIQPASRLVTSARSILPTVTDQPTSLQLNNTSKSLGVAVAELRSCAARARDACGPAFELQAASETVKEIREEVREMASLPPSRLSLLPGETTESACRDLNNAGKSVAHCVSSLVKAASQGDESYTASSATETATSLRNLAGAARAVSATVSRQAPLDATSNTSQLFESCEEVISRSYAVIEDAKRTLREPEHTDSLQRAASRVSQALSDCVRCVPGQRDVDEAIAHMETQLSQLIDHIHMGTDRPQRPFAELQTEIAERAERVNSVATDVTTSVQAPVKLASWARRLDGAVTGLVTTGVDVARQTKDNEVQNKMVISLKNVTVVSSRLLTTAKSVSVDPSSPNAHNRLTAAARAVTESINNLVDVCTSAAPGQKDCDNTIRSIESMRPLLDQLSQPVNSYTYFECLDKVTDSSKALGNGMTGIANHARSSQYEQFGESVRSVGRSVCSLVEAAAQAAYLVGVAQPGSKAGTAGLVDQSLFCRALNDITAACSVLCDSSVAPGRTEVMGAAKEIAKHTSALCNACRVASCNTTNTVAKRQFVQSAKDVANSTANLVKEIKALDMDNEYREDKRRNCAAACRPVLDAVESLVQYASSREFSGERAVMSPAARVAQAPIVDAAGEIVRAAADMVRAAKSLVVTPKDPPTWLNMADNSKRVSDSIKRLVAAIRDSAPGQEQCEQAIEIITEQIRQLDQACLVAVSTGLAQHKAMHLRGYTDNVQAALAEMTECIEPLRLAAKGETENIGHTVNRLVAYVEPLVSSIIAVASNMAHSKQQMVLLNQAKSVTEAVLQFVHTTKECRGNPKAIKLHAELDDCAEGCKETMEELSSSVDRLSSEEGVATVRMVETINRAVSKLNDITANRHRSSLVLLEGGDGYVDYQTRMVSEAKEIARIAQEMAIKRQGGQLSSELTQHYVRLATDCQGARVTSHNPEVAGRITTAVVSLGGAVVTAVTAAAECHDTVDSNAVGDLSVRTLTDAVKDVSAEVSQVLSALQAGSRGTQACINAASTVSGIIGDLDTTIMFATAGTLNAESEGDTFADHRENILKTAKALVEDTKTLVAGAASSQEQLAVAAQNAVSTIIQLAEVVKFGAASLGSNNPEAQVMLINAVKDVASALGDLIQATKAASGKSINDPTMNTLKESAKVMVTNVTSLLKTVKAVEDEHTRGTRALESTIEVISQEIRALHSVEHGSTATGSPEMLVRCTKPITLATARAVAAGNSCKQEDIIVAANMGRKAVSDMLTVCKATAHNAETAELRERCLRTGEQLAEEYRILLQTVQAVSTKSAGSDKTELTLVSRKIAQYVTELVAVAEQLKGSDWVDPDDPQVIAENELLGAAASIDAAAKKLAGLRPRKSISQETDDSLNFDEMILEAAKSIAAATSALVKAASAAQRELIDSGKVSRRPLTSSDDGQWSEGLISAARLVAAATHSLVESANCLVQGVSSEEKLVSSAKQVASWTAHLLVACKVKADANSDTTKRLQAAGNAVKRATDNLVKAAQQAIQQEEERSLVLNRKMVGGIAQEINARSEVLRIERELEEARGRLTAIRQAKYKRRGGAGDTNDSDIYDTRIEETFSSVEPMNGTMNSTTEWYGTLGSASNGGGRAGYESSSPSTPERMYVSSTETKSKIYHPSGNNINTFVTSTPTSKFHQIHLQQQSHQHAPPPPPLDISTLYSRNNQNSLVNSGDYLNGSITDTTYTSSSRQQKIVKTVQSTVSSTRSYRVADT
ncbi:talin_middle and talin-RS domain-containing protein rhea isoform X4 [Rhodnius prolixus]|uniref:talin_middle and talin-RS domain-containing protein rhea isoform X4 n=1 Tax=Rhodnius prolixus TaxID=13249 RepID=UPI003D18AA45